MALMEENMKKLLVLVDTQVDFMTGVLGSEEAKAIIPNVIEKIKHWDGDIVVTLDTHNEDYMKTREGKFLPFPHCIFGTPGHKIEPEIQAALDMKKIGGTNIFFVLKPTFGCIALPKVIAKNGKYNYLEFIGVCTDVCLVANCLVVKSAYPEVDMAVDASCCAGTTPEKHKAALMTMESCQVRILGNGPDGRK